MYIVYSQTRKTVMVMTHLSTPLLLRLHVFYFVRVERYLKHLKARTQLLNIFALVILTKT